MSDEMPNGSVAHSQVRSRASDLKKRLTRLEAKEQHRIGEVRDF